MRTIAEIHARVNSLKAHLVRRQRATGLTEDWGMRESHILEDYAGPLQEYSMSDQLKILRLLIGFAKWCMTRTEVPR